MQADINAKVKFKKETLKYYPSARKFSRNIFWLNKKKFNEVAKILLPMKEMTDSTVTCLVDYVAFKWISQIKCNITLICF